MPFSNFQKDIVSLFKQNGNLPARYEIRYKKLGLPEAEKAISNITYNITGSNARINNNSVDNSTNIININQEVADHISLLRQEIQKLVHDTEQQRETLELVDAIKGQFESSSPSKAVLGTLINALPSVGNIASIGSFLLSCVGG
jgi:hypothetical protein